MRLRSSTGSVGTLVSEIDPAVTDEDVAVEERRDDDGLPSLSTYGMSRRDDGLPSWRADDAGLRCSSYGATFVTTVDGGLTKL